MEHTFTTPIGVMTSDLFSYAYVEQKPEPPKKQLHLLNTKSYMILVYVDSFYKNNIHMSEKKKLKLENQNLKKEIINLTLQLKGVLRGIQKYDPNFSLCIKCFALGDSDKMYKCVYCKEHFCILCTFDETTCTKCVEDIP